MNVVYIGLGAVLLVGTIGDILWTTLWDEGGAGPYTSRLMKWAWHALSELGGRGSRVLSTSGPVILVLTLASWLLFIWIGWTLIFAGGTNAIFSTLGGGPVSWFDLLYFAGYTMFTLGNGGFAPREGVWQIATVLSTASGMLFITLSVTYILQVLGAVTQKHSFANGVTGLGQRPEVVIQTYWNGEKFDALDLQLNTFSSQINTLTSNHKAYPILHYFYGAQSGNDPVVAISILDEMLLLLQFGIVERHQPSEALLKSSRSSIQSYLETLDTLHITNRPADRSPPSPSLTDIRDEGLPTVPDEAFADAIDDEDLDRRRRTLYRLVKVHERQWPVRRDE